MGWQDRVDRGFLDSNLKADRYSPEALAFETYQRVDQEDLVPLSDLCESILPGHRGISLSEQTIEGGVPALGADDLLLLAERPAHVEQLPILPHDRGQWIHGRGVLVAAWTRAGLIVLDPSSIPGLEEFVPVGADVAVLHARPGVNTGYVKAVLESEGAIQQLGVNTLSARGHLDAKMLGSISVPRPESAVGRELLSRLYWRPSVAPRSSPARELRLVAPLSPRDAVGNALGIVGAGTRPGLLREPVGAGLYLPLEGGTNAMIARVIEPVGGRWDEIEPSRASIQGGFDLDPVAEAIHHDESVVLNRVWSAPSVPPNYLDAPAVHAAVLSFSDDAATEIRSVESFLLYTRETQLLQRLEALTAASESAGHSTEPEDIIQSMWDERTAGEPPDASGQSMSDEHRALLAVAPNYAAFRKFVLACFAPLLLVGVRSHDGVLTGCLVVPLEPTADDMGIAVLAEALKDELRRQIAAHHRVQQEIANEIVGRVSHIFRNRLGILDADLKKLTEAARGGGWDEGWVEPEEQALILGQTFHHPAEHYTVGGYLARLASHIEQLRHVVDRMRQYFRGGSREPEDVAINSEIERAVADWHGRRPDVEIARDLDPIQPLVHMPLQDFREILDNVLDNSSRHMPAALGPAARHRLDISTRYERDRVVIEIRNSGESDLPPNPADLWVTTDAEHGTGLGLATVRRNAAASQGSFDLFRNASGPGVTNRLVFPAARRRSPDKPEA